jgi:hypothetical protein
MKTTKKESLPTKKELLNLKKAMINYDSKITEKPIPTKKHKSMFSLMTENNAEGHKLSIALGMVGIDVNPMYAKLILETQAMMRKMGGKFDLKTACDMKHKFSQKLESIQDTFNNQQTK